MIKYTRIVLLVAVLLTGLATAVVYGQAGPTPTPTTRPGVTFGPIVGPGHTLIPTETRIPPTLPPTVMPTDGPSPTPGPELNSDLMGIQIHPHIDSGEFNQTLNYASELGMGWIKFQFNWSLLESGPGEYTQLFYMLRLYVQQAHLRGFKVMVSVAKAPDWARSPAEDGVHHENGPPDDPATLANFVSGLLKQYGMDVNGDPYISAIEIWNEPNLQREWYAHALTGSEYMRYFQPAFDAVRQFSPKVTVITAAPAPTGDSEWSTNDRNWLQQLYDAGLAQYGQNVMVGIHPYGWANAPETRCCVSTRGWDDQPQFFFLDTLADYWDIMQRNGHINTQLWGTEFGWATFDGLQTSEGQRPADPADAPYFGHIDQWQQAEYTLQAFYLAQERANIGPMFLWNLNFAATNPDGVDQSDPQTAYSILATNWDPRPVYRAIQAAAKR